MAARLSVIVPFRNAAGHLGGFLDSLVGQAAVDEVIVVDAGSTDEGRSVATAYAARDPRYTLIEEAGRPFEVGVAQSTGDYLAFADPRDTLAPGAYDDLVASLERTGSDLAVGGDTNLRAVRPHRHARLFADRSLTGTVFRRSLADRLDLRSAGQVSLLAYALADRVDVLRRPIVVSDTARTSLVDSRRSVAELRDRLAAGCAVRAVLPARTRREFDRVVLVETDLYDLLDALPVADDGERDSLVAIGAAALDRIDTATVKRLPAIRRLGIWLLHRRMLPELLAVLRFERLEGAKNARRIRRGRRWYAEYPFFDDPHELTGDPELDIPGHLYDVTRELTPVARVDRAEWAGERLRVHGHAYIRGVDSAGSRLRAWLVAPRRLGFVRLAPTAVKRPDVTAATNQTAACHDESGFVVDIDPRRLTRWPPADWSLVVQVRAAGLTRWARMAVPKAERDRWTPGRAVARGRWLTPVMSGKRFGLRLPKNPAVVTSHRRDGDGLVLEGPHGHRTRLGPDDVKGERRLPVVCDADDGRYRFGDHEIALGRTKAGELRAAVRDPRPVVTRARWTGDDTLELAGDHTGPDRPMTMILRHGRSGEELAVPVTWTRDVFAATIVPARMTALGMERPMSPGPWSLLADGNAVRIARHAVAGLPDWHRTGRHEVSPDVGDDDAVRLRVRVAAPGGERGAYARHRIHTVDYPRYRRWPLRDTVVFDAYLGRQFSCNPRAVFEELRRRETGLEHIWVCADGRFAPPGATTVRLGGRAHAEAMARARALVGNFNQQDWFVKREGQLYVQCWHGTPLKKIGYDILTMPMRRTHKLSWYEHDIPQWDLLVAQTPFSTPIYRKAFRFDREILEAGHPRNDILLGPERERERHAAGIRRRLGIPEGKRVVLYAPTWRDDYQYAPGKRAFEVKLDLARVARALGPDHMVLLRTHYLVTDRAAMPGVVDVSTYPDMAELHLITDVLITDYSSSMFDFAVTGKPMVFYAYDLERYRDQVRGFYFDLESEAPGPVVRTEDEVIDALRSIEDRHAAHMVAYAAFRAKFCPLDDGRASARVADRILEIILGNE